MMIPVAVAACFSRPFEKRLTVAVHTQHGATPQHRQSELRDDQKHGNTAFHGTVDNGCDTKVQ